MASDIKTTGEDADMAECDGEKVVTMMDVLQEQEDFEEDANAVLGASDDKNCTYSKGYIKRQAIYACLTCCPEAKLDPKNRAGVCLACSLMCHENHELIELYTKRNFRCDCGNPKFNSHPCSFTSDKTDLNEDNYYNQNFSGLYCTCQRPYPDPESTIEDEMIQCIICEDWLHASHLESDVPANEQYSEMICKVCMEKNEFLHDYSDLAVNTETVEVDIVAVNGVDTNDYKLSNGFEKKDEATNSISSKIETKPDDEMMEEKLDNSAEINDTYKPESTEENENGKNIEDESEIVNIKENAKGSCQPEQNQQSNLSPEEPTSNITQELSNDQSKPNNIHKAETKADSVSNNITNDTSTLCDKLENRTNNENVSEESNDLKKSKDQDNETNMNQLGENNTTDDAEKKEEDRLLADPEDVQETVSEKNDENGTERDASINNTEQNHAETNEPKQETESRSDIEENLKACDEKFDTLNNSNEVIVQNENNSNSETLPEKVQHSVEPTNQSLSNNAVEPSSSEKRKFIEESSDNVEAKKLKLNGSLCIRPKGIKKVYKGATFWPSTFRQKLCTCQECLSMYSDLSLLFLTDPEDTVSAYENLGKQKYNGEPATQYEKGLQALSSLDRIQQINALTEYNRMRDKLLDFLKSFKDKKEIVKEEDIKAFFAGMKPKRESDGVYFCR